ncbi:hypothetical protein E3N88_14940 [Mikania micrantha]|uniref:Uncharacterized protein n=1 Tax=Mikania micrantha TaxID=192012 RepID=A0A5N6P2V5_9ASTR|nr:hypothetical protein E3N88_14940 [Mikania micrantha]
MGRRRWMRWRERDEGEKNLILTNASNFSAHRGGDSCPSFDLTLPRSKWSRFERCFRGALANIFAEADVKHVLEVILSGCCRWIEAGMRIMLPQAHMGNGGNNYMQQHQQAQQMLPQAHMGKGGWVAGQNRLILVTQRVIDVVYGPKAGTKKNENTEKAETISSKLNQFSSTDNNLIIKSGKRMNGIPQIR